MKKLKRLIKWLAFWWCFAGAAFIVAGCAGDRATGDAKYPEYEKWWTSDAPKRSRNLSDLGQGDILVFDNGMEAVLL